MFFYEEDRFKYNLHIHTETKNISFLKMSKFLYDKGIKNNKFPLYLYHKELRNIPDVTALEDPSLELAQMIALECRMNPWYFMREMVKVPAAGGAKPFILHRGNMALIWCFYQNIDTYLMMPRQFYKTVSTMAIVAQVMYFLAQSFEIVLFTKDSSLIGDNVERLKVIKEHLPPWLIEKSSKDKDNKEGLSYHAARTEYKTVCQQEDPFAADKKGRGASTPMQHWDEIEMIKNLRTMFGAAVAGTHEARRNAAQKGMPHANIYTSTAGYLDTDECQFCQELKSNGLMFTEKLYDLNNTHVLKDILRQSSSNQMMLIVFSFLQLGKTHQWLNEQVARENASPDKVKRDYYLIATSGSGESDIDSRLLEQMRISQVDPDITEFTQDNYVLHWYITEEFKNSDKFKQRSYVMGMDTSEANGGDSVTLKLTDVSDMSTVMTFKSNELNTQRFAIFVADFLIKYPNVTLIPENKSTGSSVIDAIIMKLEQAGINPFKRIFNDLVQNLGSDKYANEDPYRYNGISDRKLKKVFGYKTSGSGEQSRKKLFSVVLYRHINMSASRKKDAQLVNEYCNLKMKNGQLDHDNKGSTDLVVADLLTAFFIFEGKNLRFYGIDPKSILSTTDEKGNKLDQQTKINRELIANRITELYVLINEFKDSIIIQKQYQAELLSLERLLESYPELKQTDTKIINDNIKDVATPTQPSGMFSNYTVVDTVKLMMH